MKTSLTFSFMALLAAGPALQAATCSCTAADRSCSASITCSGGCYAVCGSGGACSAGCGSGDGGGIDQQNLSIGGSSGATELSQAIRDQLKEPFVYVPADSQEVLTYDFKELSASEVRRILAKRGVVATSSQDLSGEGTRKSAFLATHISLQAQNAEPATIAEALKRLSGGRFELTPKGIQGRFSLDAKGVTMKDLTRMLAGVGETRIVEPDK